MKAQHLKMIFIYLLWSILCSALPTRVFADGNEKIKNFQTAKKIITRIYRRHPKTFYCGCHYTEKELDMGSCGYISPKRSIKVKKIEWEHIVPAYAFGMNYKEWRQGHPRCKTKKGNHYMGRRCVAKTYPEFRRMEADLYNLVPPIGELNRARSNYTMSIIAGENRKYGTCDIEIKNKKVEPTESIRGDIARTYLYMDWAYPDKGILSKKNRQLFQAWQYSDPVDIWECKRAMMIKKNPRE
jgi:deoxyribonuclease I